MPSWKEIRQNTRVNGIGRLQCEWWCEDAQNYLPGYTLKVVKVGTIQIDQYATSILRHFFLQKKEGGKIMIADGTAGQFDSNYPEGYYGPVEEAPDSLKTIYLKPRINQ
jgi:hypothetical protein